MNARRAVDIIKDAGLRVRSLSIEGMNATTLLAYASRQQRLNRDQSRRIADAVRVASVALECVANDIEAKANAE